jgi:hypothetical protein
MDPHVKRLADLLTAAQSEAGGEIYEAVTYDDEGRPVEVCPAWKLDVEGRVVNVVLFDVPGSRDHFSVIVNAEPQFIMSLREEARWDRVLKTFQRVEDHQIGVSDFDRKYLVGGRPEAKVVAFLRQPEVRRLISSIEPILSLACDDGFVRATFPLTPASRYGLDDVRARVTTMKRLAEAAEA